MKSNGMAVQFILFDVKDRLQYTGLKNESTIEYITSIADSGTDLEEACTEARSNVKGACAY